MTEDVKDKWRVFFKDEGKKWIARVSFGMITAILISVATPVGVKLQAIWNSPESLHAIEDKLDARAAIVDGKLDAIGETLLRMSGDGRVTRQPDDMSYVREPVTVGAPIVLVLFIGRTEVGTGCILREIIPSFTDENDVQRSGAPRRPMRQLGPEVVRRELQIDQPSGLVPGRTRVQLQLEYTCGDETIFETTKPVFYYATAV